MTAWSFTLIPSGLQERVGDRTLIYDYKLFWWRFQPGANLVKAAETNLFADSDSNRTHMQELVLYVCEWGNSDYILVRAGLPFYIKLIATKPLPYVCVVNLVSPPSMEGDKL